MTAKTVLVIDDSALMRRKLTEILTGGGYDVVTARDGQHGLELARELAPDVITLDINMPVMDGITCLSLLISQGFGPVIMVSSLTEEGALATFEALELGALDYVAKPGGTVSVNMASVEQELLAKVAAAIRTKPKSALRRAIKKPLQKKTVTPKRVSKEGIVVIGVSTGGPGTVEAIISELEDDFPVPIVIAQHMPARFTQVFSERLNKACDLDIVHVDKPAKLESGKVFIGRGDADMVIVRRAGKLMAMSVPESDHLWHPSVSLLMASVNELYTPNKIIAVMLTGMGSDGAKEMAEAYRAGAKTIAESEESSVVFGMPKELIALGGATKVLNSDAVAGQLKQWAARL